MSMRLKLTKIEILKEHEDRAKKLLEDAGYVPRSVFPGNNHRYHVSDEEMKILDDNKIVYDRLKQRN